MVSSMIQVVEVLADLFRAAPMCSTDDGSRRGRSTAASSGRRPRHQRRLLVSAGVLPQREEYLSRLETAFSRMIEQTPGEDRGSSPGISNGTCCRVSGDGSRPAVTRTNMHPGTRHAVRAATPGRRTPLARREEIGSLRQPVLDQWLTRRRSDAISVSVFLRWAGRHRFAPSVNLPVQRINDPMDFNDPAQQGDCCAAVCTTTPSAPDPTSRHPGVDVRTARKHNRATTRLARHGGTVHHPCGSHLMPSRSVNRSRPSCATPLRERSPRWQSAE